MVRYRGRLEIIADILSAAQNSSKKTQIMYQANLSYRLLSEYLDLVLKTGLVCLDDDGCYVITEKGRRFLERCTEYLNHKRRLDRHLSKVDNAREKLEELCSSME